MAGATVRETVTLAGRAERATAARTFVSEVLGPEHPCGDVAVLLVSEVFGNSVRHSGSGATPGAGWTDPAFWPLRLMARGHTAEQAEVLVARLPAYAAADPAHIDAFARANVRMWNEIGQSNKSPWAKTMARTARTWAQYRQTRP